MIWKNYSKKCDYHTQINNKVVPHASCNTTSMVMALKQAGVPLPFPQDEQPEDYLTSFLRQRESYEMMRELTPWFFDKTNGKALYPPNEVHKMLEWGVNTLLGRTVVQFSTEVLITTLFDHIHKGGGAVLSGEFPLKNGKKLRHIVSLAGTVEDDGETVGVIIDDPYGDWRTDYQDCRGNDVEMSLLEFQGVFRPRWNKGVKWAHLVG
jgi:hypothetical protein